MTVGFRLGYEAARDVESVIAVERYRERAHTFFSAARCLRTTVRTHYRWPASDRRYGIRARSRRRR